jgi:hypothetical protein
MILCHCKLVVVSLKFFGLCVFRIVSSRFVIPCCWGFQKWGATKLGAPRWGVNARRRRAGVSVPVHLLPPCLAVIVWAVFCCFSVCSSVLGFEAWGEQRYRLLCFDLVALFLSRAVKILLLSESSVSMAVFARLVCLLSKRSLTTEFCGPTLQ